MSGVEADCTVCPVPVPGAWAGAQPVRDAEYRRDCIANAALQHAIGRGFVPGFEEQDWISAEAQVLAEMYGLTGFSS